MYQAFCGLNGRTERPEFPNHLKNKRNLSDSEVDELPTFSDLYHSFPRSFQTSVAWQNPMTGEWVETDRFQALIDPDRVGDWMSEQTEQNDPLWTIPTDSYGVVNPVDFYQPLEEVLLENDLSSVFGEATYDKRGGEVSITLMFSTDLQSLPERAGDALYTGIRTGYSHLGNKSLFAEGFAQDTTCSNSMHGLTGRKTRRHVGDAKSDVDWWEDLLADYGAIPDLLGDMIEEAIEVQFHISDLPFESWEELYTVAGYPSYLARSAASHATARSNDPFEVNAWELHAGATYALTHTFSGNADSDTKKSYYQTANDMLQNPVMFIDSLRNQYETWLIAQERDEEYIKEATEKLIAYEETLEDKKEEYEENQSQMAAVLLGDENEEAE